MKGVSWHKGAGTSQVYLNVNNKRRNISLFMTAHDAAVAYDRAAQGEFGEFALTNQMLGLIQENKEEL